jgi:hypothetical protein
MDPLRVHRPALATQQHRQTTIAEADPHSGQLAEPLPQRVLVITDGAVAQGADAHRNEPRRPALAQTIGRLSSAPIPPVCSACEASQLFSDHLLQDVAIERQVRDHLFQFGVFVAQRAELAQLGQAKPGELLLPAVKRLLADAEPTADLGDFLAASTW